MERAIESGPVPLANKPVITLTAEQKKKLWKTLLTSPLTKARIRTRNPRQWVRVVKLLNKHGVQWH